MRTASRTRASEPSAPPADRWGRALLAGAVLAALAGGAQHLRAGTRPEAIASPGVTAGAQHEARRAPRTRAATVRAAVGASTPGERVAAKALPASLRGTTEDGALPVDADGDLVLGPGVLRFFDYYLSATGEERPAAIHARIVEAIHRRIAGDRARGQAEALLDTYLGYREASRGLAPEGDDPDARFVAIKELRRRHFGAEAAEKLFGQEERAMAVALEQRRLLADPTLSPAERDRRLAEAEARLPPDVRAARAAATRPLRERSEEEAMRAAGASDEDVRAYRVAQDGEEAADRLAELDQRRAAWQGRLTAFQAAYAEIAAAQPDPDQRSVAVKQLLDASFSPLEQIRVAASGRLGPP